MKTRRVLTRGCWKFMLPCFEDWLPLLSIHHANKSCYVKTQPVYLFLHHHGLDLAFMQLQLLPLAFSVQRGPISNPTGTRCGRRWDFSPHHLVSLWLILMELRSPGEASVEIVILSSSHLYRFQLWQSWFFPGSWCSFDFSLRIM